MSGAQLLPSSQMQSDWSTALWVYPQLPISYCGIDLSSLGLYKLSFRLSTCLIRTICESGEERGLQLVRPGSSCDPLMSSGLSILIGLPSLVTLGCNPTREEAVFDADHASSCNCCPFVLVCYP